MTQRSIMSFSKKAALLAAFFFSASAFANCPGVNELTPDSTQLRFVTKSGWASNAFENAMPELNRVMLSSAAFKFVKYLPSQDLTIGNQVACYYSYPETRNSVLFIMTPLNAEKYQAGVWGKPKSVADDEKYPIGNWYTDTTQQFDFCDVSPKDTNSCSFVLLLADKSKTLVNPFRQ